MIRPGCNKKKELKLIKSIKKSEEYLLYIQLESKQVPICIADMRASLC